MKTYFKVSMRDVIITVEEGGDLSDVYVRLGEFFIDRSNNEPIKTDEAGRIDNQLSAYRVSDAVATELGIDVNA